MSKIAAKLKAHWPILVIVAISLTLRLFRIADYMTFLGDEGRDALVWLRMIRQGKFVLIGPQTSIGNMYLGPLFYYLMLPFFILMGTVGPSIGTALFAGATTYLLWRTGKEWFSARAGLVAALLYALSPVAIILSRSAWNPNIMPFFALLAAWGVWQFWQKDNYWWLAAEGVILSFAVQSHYLGILLFPFVGLFFFYKLFLVCKEKKEAKSLLLPLGGAVLCFLALTLLPLIWFDLRHNFVNYRSFYQFFTVRQSTVSLKPYKAIPESWPLWQLLVTRLAVGGNFVVGFWLSLVSLLLAAWQLVKSQAQRRRPLILVLVWLGAGIMGMGLYKQHIYDHYFGFLFPAVFLLLGAIVGFLWEGKKPAQLLAGVLLAVLISLSLKELPLKYPPNQQMRRTAEVCQKIVEQSEDKPFNLGMIAKQNYDAGYRYFLEKWEHKPVEINAQLLSSTLTEQLFVVCEIDSCQPVGHAQAEIANFGWAKVADEWSFPWEVKLLKLIHYSEKNG